jgi:branched-chain amino acid transport system ATP-binding protein
MGRSGGAFRFFRSAGQDRKLTEPATRHLARVGLEGRARERTSDLSHGERRKLEIAIALAMRPRAFLLDEPMAGLGQTGSQILTPLLSSLREEAPLLLVEHDMDAVFALADRISVLVSGRIIATGTPAEIRADSQVREAYLGDLA